MTIIRIEEYINTRHTITTSDHLLSFIEDAGNTFPTLKLERLQSNLSYVYTFEHTESLKHDTNSTSESRGEKDDMISTPTNTFGSSSTPHSITKHNLVFLHIPKNAGTRPLKRMHLPLAYHGVTACLYETNEIKKSRSPSATPTRTSILNMSTCKWIWTNCISSWQTFYNGQSTLLALPLFKIYQLIYTKNLW